MARPLAPATANDVHNVAAALSDLRAARQRLSAAGCPSALASVQAAIKSTEGALRHVQRRADATAAPKPGLRYDTGLDDTGL